jgi:hypothetical protein
MNKIDNGYKERLRECKISVRNPFGIQINMELGVLIDLIKDELREGSKSKTPPSE